MHENFLFFSRALCIYVCVHVCVCAVQRCGPLNRSELKPTLLWAATRERESQDGDDGRGNVSDYRQRSGAVFGFSAAFEVIAQSLSHNHCIVQRLKNVTKLAQGPQVLLLI